MVAHAWNSSPWGEGVGGSGVQSHVCWLVLNVNTTKNQQRRGLRDCLDQVGPGLPVGNGLEGWGETHPEWGRHLLVACALDGRSVENVSWVPGTEASLHLFSVGCDASWAPWSDGLQPGLVSQANPLLASTASCPVLCRINRKETGSATSCRGRWRPAWPAWDTMCAR